MSNHPWRRNSHMFTCEPNCADRKPGCQDHCEKHVREKAEYNKRAAIENRRRYLDNYTCKQISYYQDRRAKCGKGGYLKKTDNSSK